MVVRTKRSLYEIRLGEGRFRRTNDGRRGEWQRFDQIGPIAVGEPMRFFWEEDAAGTAGRIGMLTTGPVERIVDEGRAGEHISRTFQPQPAFAGRGR